MGVIYKLKEDVIAFILDQKKRNPSSGIRKIAAITGEKFQIKVSKSSVSAILKDASLSSTIGRRPGGSSGTAKFTIPPNKKVEILMNMQKTGFAEGKASEEKRNNDKEEALPLAPDLLAQEKRPPADGWAKKEIAAQDTTKDKDFFERVEQLRNEKKSQNREIINGMGFVFLMAAQWELLSKHSMSQLFKSHVSTTFHDSFDVACEIFLFLKFLDAGSMDHDSAYYEHGLWKLNKFDDENNVLASLKELFQLSASITDASATSIAMEYDLEKKYFFSQASSFKLLIEDGTKLKIDAAMSSLNLNVNVPINKSIIWLSRYLISNIHSLVLFTVPGKKMFDQVFYDMVAIFENFPGKKIQKVVILDQNNKEITEFSTIPALRRTFLVGITPHQEEFADLTKNSRWVAKVPFCHQESGRIVYYGETKTGILSTHFQEKVEDFRVIFVWQNKEEGPFWAILTNQMRGSGEDILRTYMSRWPYFGKLEQEQRENSQPDSAEGDENIPTYKCGKLEFKGIFSDFIGVLNRYCQKHYFPSHYSEKDISDIMQMVYETQGSLYEEKDHIIASLNVPESSQYRKDIEYALKRVNERHIFDHFGRKLWIEI